MCDFIEDSADGKPAAPGKSGFAATKAALKDQVWIGDDFDTPLPSDLIHSFGAEE